MCNIYKVKKCDYCDTGNVIVRPSMHMGDRAMMCKNCWEHDREEAQNCFREYGIGTFESGPGYEEYKLTLEKDGEKEFQVFLNLSGEVRIKANSVLEIERKIENDGDILMNAVKYGELELEIEDIHEIEGEQNNE